jgi:trans-aconitate methyltransferase
MVTLIEFWRSMCQTRLVERPSWAPGGVNIDQPSVARVYDYYLGGSHNFEADRTFAVRVIAAVPNMRWVISENRAFLRRSVRFMVGQGIDQFVDLGSGIPTVGNVHEVVGSLNPSANVVYIDHDPVAVAHSRAILGGNPHAVVISGDLRSPKEVLAIPELLRLIDLSRPVGVLLNAVLHFVPDDNEAARIVSELAGSVVPGSYIAISHASADQMQAGAQRTESLYNQSVAAMAMRSHDQVTSLFGGLKLVEPGVVKIPMWNPDSSDDLSPLAEQYPGYAGVALVG